jgi:TIGR03009 family protein
LAKKPGSAAEDNPDGDGFDEGPSFMRRLGAFLAPLLVILSETGLAPPDDVKQPAAPRAQQDGLTSVASRASSLDKILKKWEVGSAALKTLEFSIYRIDREQQGAEQHFEGHVAFKAPRLAYRDLRRVKLVPDGSQKMAPQLDTRKRPVSTPLDTTVWSGAEVWRYTYDTKHVSIYRLDKDLGQQRPEDVPLPLVFNVRADDIRRRYNVELHDANPIQYLIKLTPRNAEERDVNGAWIILDARSFLPSRIVLLRADSNRTEDYNLSQFRVNQPVNESFFKTVLPGKPWKIDRYPRAHTNSIAVRHPEKSQVSGRSVPNPNQPR